MGSIPVRVIKALKRMLESFYFTRTGIEQGGGIYAVSNQPSGLLLSLRFPTCRNVYREACR